MNDLITAATSGLFVEVGKIIEHMKAQQARIADLERQLAEASAPAVDQQKPLGWLRKWAFDGETPRKEKGKWVAKFRLLPITQHQAFNDDVPLYAAPHAADTDKVREAIANISNSQITEAWESCGGVGGFYKSFGYQQFAHAVLDLAADALSSMAAQAPVREVPGWISVKDRLPAQGMPVFVYTPANKHSDERIDFDCIDPEDDTASTWDQHNQHYEHWCCVAKPEGSIGPSAEAPYTHWMPLPAAPVQQEGDRG